jgi:hypothetical protein
VAKQSCCGRDIQSDLTSDFQKDCPFLKERLLRVHADARNDEQIIYHCETRGAWRSNPAVGISDLTSDFQKDCFFLKERLLRVLADARNDKHIICHCETRGAWRSNLAVCISDLTSYFQDEQIICHCETRGAWRNNPVVGMAFNQILLLISNRIFLFSRRDCFASWRTLAMTIYNLSLRDTRSVAKQSRSKHDIQSDLPSDFQ